MALAMALAMALPRRGAPHCSGLTGRAAAYTSALIAVRMWEKNAHAARRSCVSLDWGRMQAHHAVAVSVSVCVRVCLCVSIF